MALGPAVGTASTYGPYSYCMQSPDSNQYLFGKYYALHDVIYDSGVWILVEWRDEKRKLHCWQQLSFAFGNERNVENHRHAEREAAWIQRRGDSGFANTLIRELECED